MHISWKNKSSPILSDFARTPLYTKKVPFTPSRIRLRARMRVESVLTGIVHEYISVFEGVNDTFVAAC